MAAPLLEFSTPQTSPTPVVPSNLTPTPAPHYKDAKWPDGRILTHPEHLVNTGVVNVKPNDTLKLRRGPGTRFGIVAEIPPSATDISAFDQDQFWDGNTWWCPVEFTRPASAEGRRFNAGLLRLGERVRVVSPKHAFATFQRQSVEPLGPG